MSEGGAHSSSSRWRSEEDYYLARLANSLGMLDEPSVERGLQAQAASFAAGTPIALGDVLVREGLLTYDVLLNLMHELMRSRHTCGGCQRVVYTPAGPVAREEPCPHCGAPVMIPPAASVTQSGFVKRDQAMQLSGSFRMSKNQLAGAGQGPTLFGNYILEKELARGGMGAVYKVRHGQTGREMALKVMLAGSAATEKQVHRFKREAKAQFELDHPNIVKIHDVGENDGVLYYAMDLVSGKSLDDFDSFQLNDRLGILAKTCRAIHHAHEHGYIHRDLKPANILINSRNEPLVTDFGLAKNLDGQTMLTQEGAVMGTPYYMAPEQAMGAVSQMGPHTDVFALGVLLYQMVTRELPFEANTAIELYRRIIDVHPKSFAEHGVMAPELELVAFKAIEKAPELRYPNALDLAEDIERCMRGEKPHASAVSSARRMAMAAGKHKRSIGFIVGMVILGLLVLIGLALGFRAARAHFKEAQQLAEREAAALVASADLDQAFAQAESQPPREAIRFVDEAVGSADSLLDSEGPIPESFADLRGKRAEGLIVRARLALGEGSGAGAALALSCLERAQPDAGDKLLGRLLGLRVRACWRLGRTDDADAALAELETIRGERRAVDLLKARRARLTGFPAEALQALGSASGVEAELERAQAQLALGKQKEAEAAVKRAVEKTGSPGRVHLAWGEALLSAGQLRGAGDACRAGFMLDPGDVTVARRMASTYFAAGRPMEAASLLRWGLKRHAGVMELEVLLTRARFLSGEDVAEKANSLRELPEGSLLYGDLRAAAGEADPYAALASAEPRRRVTYARWQADQGKAPAGVEELSALLEQVPQDRPPSPSLTRAMRDLAWVLRAAGDTEGAKRAARAALRGSPGDVDACFVLAHLDEKAKPELERAFVAEVENLQGPLGRGLFIGRHIRWANRALNRKELVARARRLLRVRLAGQPSIYPARVELAALAKLVGEEPQPTGDGAGLADWSKLLPPRRRRVIADKAMTAKVRAARKKNPNTTDELSIKRARAVLKISPDDPVANWELAQNLCRTQGRTAELRLGYLNYMRLDPGYAWEFTYDYVRDWIQDVRFGAFDEPRKETEHLQKKTPQRPRYQVPWIMDHYFGTFYPKGVEKVRWSTDAAPHEVIRRIDGLLRHEPEFAMFLYHRAHLISERQDNPWEEVERDLTLVGLMAGVETTGGNHDRGGSSQDFKDFLYRMWIYAPSRLDDAFAQLDKVLAWKNRNGRSLAWVWGAKDVVQFKKWVEWTEQFADLREDPRYKEFVGKFRADPDRK